MSHAASGSLNKLKALSKSAKQNRTLYNYENPDRKLLETFKNPAPSSENTSMLVHIEVPEFSSLCPLTGQPDFATIIIDYLPNEVCVESKSLKLYMMCFRQHGEFHESCVQRMLSDLVGVLQPKWLRVIGKFTPRGGIPFHPTATFSDESKMNSEEIVAVNAIR